MSLLDYDRPSLTTDLVLFRVNKKEAKSLRKNDDLQLEVLLLLRQEEPFLGMLSLPGGFVNIGESLDSNVRRKLKEKVGIVDSFYMEQLFTEGNASRDPRGWVATVTYLGLCTDTVAPTMLTSTSWGWYPVNEVLQGDYGALAFDHIQFIKYALTRPANKIEYTDIAFNLLPDEFTLPELESIYEAILNKKMYNFRRKIINYVEPTGRWREGKQFRPAELHKKKASSSSNL